MNLTVTTKTRDTRVGFGKDFVTNRTFTAHESCLRGKVVERKSITGGRQFGQGFMVNIMEWKNRRTASITEPIRIITFMFRKTNTYIMIKFITKTTGSFRFIMGTDVAPDTEFLFTRGTDPRIIRIIAQIFKIMYS